MFTLEIATTHTKMKILELSHKKNAHVFMCNSKHKIYGDNPKKKNLKCTIIILKWTIKSEFIHSIFIHRDFQKCKKLWCVIATEYCASLFYFHVIFFESMIRNHLNPLTTCVQAENPLHIAIRFSYKNVEFGSINDFQEIAWKIFFRQAFYGIIVKWRWARNRIMWMSQSMWQKLKHSCYLLLAKCDKNMRCDSLNSFDSFIRMNVPFK